MDEETKGKTPTGAASTDAQHTEDDIEALIASIKADPEKAARSMRDLRRENASRRKRADELETQATRLAELEQAQRAEQEQALKEQGKWKELAEARSSELEALKTERDGLAAYRKAFEGLLKQRIEALPEAHRKLVPEGDPIKVLAWLDAATEAGVIGREARKAPEMDPGDKKQPDAKEVAKQSFLSSPRRMTRL